MPVISLGVVASLLSAATAAIITTAGLAGTEVLWLLLAQYVIGIAFFPPRRLPVAPVRYHALRLLAGLWTVGGYFLALSVPGASSSEISMLLNLAPIIAVIAASRSVRARFGALLASAASVGVIGVSGWEASSAYARILAVSAALAYAYSIPLLGWLQAHGERASTTSAIYNGGGAIVVTSLILVLQPRAPDSWWPVLLVGALSAARLGMMSFAARNPDTSARVSVLANLAFVWLAIWEQVTTDAPHPLRWLAMALVVVGCSLANIPGRTRR